MGIAGRWRWYGSLSSARFGRICAMRQVIRRLAIAIFTLASLLGGGVALGGWTYQYVSQTGFGGDHGGTITDAQGAFTITDATPGHVGFSYRATADLTNWGFNFSPPPGQVLQVGTYT